MVGDRAHVRTGTSDSGVLQKKCVMDSSKACVHSGFLAGFPPPATPEPLAPPRLWAACALEFGGTERSVPFLSLPRLIPPLPDLRL